jgi:hypothetical protein
MKQFLNITIDVATHAKLKALAETESAALGMRVSMADIIRQSLKEYEARRTTSAAEEAEWKRVRREVSEFPNGEFDNGQHWQGSEAINE